MFSISSGALERRAVKMLVTAGWAIDHCAKVLGHARVIGQKRLVQPTSVTQSAV